MAFDNLHANRLRSVLTIFGVVIGVLVVVVVASILTGMRRNIVDGQEYGTSNIFAFHLAPAPARATRPRRVQAKASPPRGRRGDPRRGRRRRRRRAVRVHWLEDRAIAYRREHTGGRTCRPVSANYADVTNLNLRDGRSITEPDDEHRRPVLVIGPNVADALFGPAGRGAGREVTFAGRPVRSAAS